METVIISSKYQIVIPKKIRELTELKPGQRLQVFASGNGIEFIPVKDVKESRGFLKGMDTEIEREDDRV